jgi:hypothetical protein
MTEERAQVSFWRVWRPFLVMLSEDDGTFFVVGQRRSDVSLPSSFVGVFVTLLFGGIHCIACSFHFPSHSEQTIWRSSSIAIAITGVPFAATCLALIDGTTTCLAPTSYTSFSISFPNLFCSFCLSLLCVPLHLSLSNCGMDDFYSSRLAIVLRRVQRYVRALFSTFPLCWPACA